MDIQAMNQQRATPAHPQRPGTHGTNNISDKRSIAAVMGNLGDFATMEAASSWIQQELQRLCAPVPTTTYSGGVQQHA
eukprot:8995227-Pyramimonas_sp.AAC.1